jgi:hypothetical protein
LQRPRAPRKPAAIETDRARLIVEMEQLRNGRQQSARPVETAQVLLTRGWARASWKTREQLINAADWLVRLERKYRAQLGV